MKNEYNSKKMIELHQFSKKVEHEITDNETTDNETTDDETTDSELSTVSSVIELDEGQEQRQLSPLLSCSLLINDYFSATKPEAPQKSQFEIELEQELELQRLMDDVGAVEIKPTI